MRVSIIGSGFIAHTHAQAIRALGHEITVVISSKAENAKKFAEKWNIPRFGTHFKLALEHSDCIHLCTPPMVHYQHAKAALLLNKHVICEKPLTIGPAQAKELWTLAKSRKLIAAVNFNVRYHEASARAKKLINNTDFGVIRMVHGAYLQEFHAESDFYSWRYKEKLGGKMRAVTEIGSHWIDLVRHWTSLEIAAVSANFAHFDKKRYATKEGLIHTQKQPEAEQVEVTSEDAAIVSFKFSNGAIGNVVLSEISHGKKNELTLEITGSQQSLSWNNEQPYQLKLGQKNHGLKIDTNPFGGGFDSTFMAFFKEVYKAIEDETAFDKCTFPTFQDGYINALICDAIYQSAQQDATWVKVEVD